MKKKGIAILGCILLIIFDQLTKLQVLVTLKGQDPIVLIPGVLEFQYVENRGAAFGILQNQQWFFILAALVTVLVLFFLLWKMPEDNIRFLPMKVCLYLIIAGAVGNVIDRFIRRYVVDFIYFKLIDFPVFNVADIYVTVAAFLLIFLVLFYYKEDEFERMFSLHKSHKGKIEE